MKSNSTRVLPINKAKSVVIAHTKFDNKWFRVYNRVLFSQKELEMGLRYDTMGEMIATNEQEKRQVRMYGCTEDQMREAVEQSSTFRFSGPAMMAASLMSDAQEMINTEYGDIDYMRAEDARQCLNRAKWILFEYCDKR
jgi:hypothetical protein